MWNKLIYFIFTHNASTHASRNCCTSCALKWKYNNKEPGFRKARLRRGNMGKRRQTERESDVCERVCSLECGELLCEPVKERVRKYWGVTVRLTFARVSNSKYLLKWWETSVRNLFPKKVLHMNQEPRSQGTWLTPAEICRLLQHLYFGHALGEVSAPRSSLCLSTQTRMCTHTEAHMQRLKSPPTLPPGTLPLFRLPSPGMEMKAGHSQRKVGGKWRRVWFAQQPMAMRRSALSALS